MPAGGWWLNVHVRTHSGSGMVPPCPSACVFAGSRWTLIVTVAPSSLLVMIFAAIRSSEDVGSTDREGRRVGTGSCRHVGSPDPGKREPLHLEAGNCRRDDCGRIQLIGRLTRDSRPGKRGERRVLNAERVFPEDRERQRLPSPESSNVEPEHHATSV